MTQASLRGIAVADAGATNTKVVLFDASLKIVAERKTPSVHRAAPPYRWIDPEPVIAFFRKALPELDQILPIDAVVPCAHGAALALLNPNGDLAMPVMDYLAEPLSDVISAYKKIEPPFSEVYGPLLPMALTHGLQLFWQKRQWPEDYARIATILPWIQYVGYRLCGKPVSEISSLSPQSQLMDIAHNRPSSLARAQGWDKLFAPMAKAWEVIGTLKPEFKSASFRGRGDVLAGVHDSNGNYLRYLAAGRNNFTLLSTGTWIIGFDTATRLDELDPARDTVSNTDVLGRPVACCRFFGGKEFEVVAAGAPAEAASLDCVEELIRRGSFALPSFTDSGGPVPGSGLRGRFDGPEPQSPEERASIASLYCALMVCEQLDAVKSRHDVIVDGPCAQNPTFLSILAALRSPQPVLASNLRDGTAAGAAILALMTDTRTIPKVALDLKIVPSAVIEGLAAYCDLWRAQARLSR